MGPCEGTRKLLHSIRRGALPRGSTLQCQLRPLRCLRGGFFIVKRSLEDLQCVHLNVAKIEQVLTVFYAKNVFVVNTALTDVKDTEHASHVSIK